MADTQFEKIRLYRTLQRLYVANEKNLLLDGNLTLNLEEGLFNYVIGSRKLPDSLSTPYTHLYGVGDRVFTVSTRSNPAYAIPSYEGAALLIEVREFVGEEVKEKLDEYRCALGHYTRERRRILNLAAAEINRIESRRDAECSALVEVRLDDYLM